MAQARADLKAQLMALVSETGDGFSSDSPEMKEIKSIIHELIDLTPISDPGNQLASVHGRWMNEFSSFGSVGGKKNKGTGSGAVFTLKLLSFAKLPEIEVVVPQSYQEIQPATGCYNNVIYFETVENGTKGVLYVKGKFRIDKSNAQRFLVDFTSIGCEPRAELMTDQDFRASLGVDPKTPLRSDFPPPKLHSDIVYLDDTMRINVGSLDGHYVLSKTPDSMESVEIV